MNKEYINLNENTYAVTNENGNLKVIKTNDEPDMVLKLQNLIEEKQNEKDDIEKQKIKRPQAATIRKLAEALGRPITDFIEKEEN